MHPCLLVSEIFELIAHFSNEEGCTPGSPAALARTCRAFYDTAETVLWRRLNGLTPLLHCFDRDICVSSGDKYVSHYFIPPVARGVLLIPV